MYEKVQSHTVGILLGGKKTIQIAPQSGPLTVAFISGSKNPWLMLHPATLERTVCLELSFSPIFIPISLHHIKNIGYMCTLFQR